MVEHIMSILVTGGGVNLILLIGIAAFSGTIGAKLFQRFHIPQVVGYVVIGLIIGESGFNLITHDTVNSLSLFSMFALGIIGFMIGAITLDGIRNTFITQELNDWLVALEIVEPIIALITPDIELSDAFEKTARLDIEYLPVVVSAEDNSLVGVLDCRATHRSLSTGVLERQQKADKIHRTPVLR